MGNTTSCCVSSSPKLRRNAHSRLEPYRPEAELSREDTGCNLQHISDRENIDVSMFVSSRVRLSVQTCEAFLLIFTQKHVCSVICVTSNLLPCSQKSLVFHREVKHTDVLRLLTPLLSILTPLTHAILIPRHFGQFNTPNFVGTVLGMSPSCSNMTAHQHTKQEQGEKGIKRSERGMKEGDGGENQIKGEGERKEWGEMKEQGEKEIKRSERGMKEGDGGENQIKGEGERKEWGEMKEQGEKEIKRSERGMKEGDRGENQIKGEGEEETERQMRKQLCYHHNHITLAKKIIKLNMEYNPSDHPRASTIFLSKSQTDVREKRKSLYVNHQHPSGPIRRKYSSCSTIFLDDSTVSQPNLKYTIKCVSLAIYYHIKNRDVDGRTLLDIFDEKLHPLSKSEVPADYDNHDPEQKQIYRFVRTLFSAAQLTAECAIVTLVYLERLLTYAEIDICPANWKRIVLGAILLASKVWDDQAVGERRLLPDPQRHHCRGHGEEVKKVQEFKYLGSTVQSNGECGKEVKKRVQAGFGMGGERCREFCVIGKYQRESRGRCTGQWNELERQFLELLQFNINVPSSVFAKYYFDLRSLSEANNLNFPLEPLSRDKAPKLEFQSCSLSLQAISRLCDDKYKDLKKAPKKRSVSMDNLTVVRWSPAIIS
ncbi:hypothetical protein QTP86_034339 [Hemibagrus guttatus]|nr:hypothetical protein QTP86_034339 [Hemibagrus guttatus]